MSLQVLDTSQPIVIIPSLFITGLFQTQYHTHSIICQWYSTVSTLTPTPVRTINILHIPLTMNHIVQSHRSPITLYTVTMSDHFRSIARPNRRPPFIPSSITLHTDHIQSITFHFITISRHLIPDMSSTIHRNLMSKKSERGFEPPLLFDHKSQFFSQSYESILPNSFTHILLCTRGCSPWKPDAVLSTPTCWKNNLSLRFSRNVMREPNTMLEMKMSVLCRARNVFSP